MLEGLANWWDNTVWQTDIHSLPGWRRRPLLLLRGIQVLLADILSGSHKLYAMGLVYMTILSLVPLLAVMFSVLKGFGVHNQLQPLLLKAFEPLGEKGIEITTSILTFVDNIKVGILGAVGLGLLLFTIISLISQVEEAFNSTWRVRNVRPLFERFSHYLSVLLIGPLLIFSAVGLSQSVRHMSLYQQLVETDAGALLYNLLSIYLPFILTVIGIAFIYMFVPNTRVKPMAALFGATITALLFKAATFVFTLFIVGSTKYTAIYSAFATVIILFIWLYITWLILLLGSSIAYYFQHAHKLYYFYRNEKLSPYENEALALQILTSVTKNYYADKPPLSLDQVSDQIHLPNDLVEKMIYKLEQGGFINIVDVDEVSLVPGRPPEETNCAELLAYIRESSKAGSQRVDMVTDQNVVKVLGQADQHAFTAIENITIKQMAMQTEFKNDSELQSDERI